MVTLRLLLLWARDIRWLDNLGYLMVVNKKMKNFTEDEEYALRDCQWCKLSEYDDEGDFVKCRSADNPSDRPLLECRYQQPDYKG